MFSTLDVSSSVPRAAVGVIGAYEGNSFAIRALIVFFTGLAMYNALELIILAMLMFSHYHSLYFWALLVASLGIIPYSLGFLLRLFGILHSNPPWTSLVLSTIGWYAVVTGQSLVLWSRLHLIVSGERGRKILLCTKWMIIIDAIILHSTTTVVDFGSNAKASTGTAGFIAAYNVVEKIQITGFFLQEVILSSIYIFETIKILRGSLHQNARRVMQQLVLVNVVIIIMDIALLSMEYASQYLLQNIVKIAFYSIKLKLEFAILGRLVKFVHGGQGEFVEMQATTTPASGSH